MLDITTLRTGDRVYGTIIQCEGTVRKDTPCSAKGYVKWDLNDYWSTILTGKNLRLVDTDFKVGDRVYAGGQTRWVGVVVGIEGAHLRLYSESEGEDGMTALYSRSNCRKLPRSTNPCAEINEVEESPVSNVEVTYKEVVKPISYIKVESGTKRLDARLDMGDLRLLMRDRHRGSQCIVLPKADAEEFLKQALKLVQQL